MAYDPTIYLGAAAHYARGRPPYSAALATVLEREAGLDGSGRLLDVGCGPGVLALELAHLFREAIGVDPDAEMLAVAARRAEDAEVHNVRWVRSLAEDLADLDLGTFQLVTFGQSFQWTRREEVAEHIYDILEPGGAMALIVPTVEGRPVPDDPGYPPLPHDVVLEIIDRYLGGRRRAGAGFRSPPADRYEDALARTRFGTPEIVFAPGRPDLLQDADGILDNYHSTSFCAPHLFGDRLDDFDQDVRAALAPLSESGLFWDWPGDTEIVLAHKP